MNISSFTVPYVIIGDNVFFPANVGGLAQDVYLNPSAQEEPLHHLVLFAPYDNKTGEVDMSEIKAYNTYLEIEAKLSPWDREVLLANVRALFYDLQALRNSLRQRSLLGLEGNLAIAAKLNGVS